MLLSLAIPTYNRAQKLNRTLADLTMQIKSAGLEREVEIVINDNHSSDGTEAVVKEHAGKGISISFTANERNLGFDRNLNIALSRTQGEYIWTLNDNIILKDSAILKMVEYIRANPEAGVIYIDTRPEFVSTVFKNGSDCLDAMGIIAGKLARCVFAKKYLPENRQRYYDNWWLHTSIFWEIAASHPVLVVGELLVPEESVCTWAKDGTVLITFVELKKIIANLISLGYDREVIAKILNEFDHDLPKTVASARLHGLKISLAAFRMIFDNSKNTPSSLIASLLILVMPVSVLKIIKKIKNSHD